MFALAARFFARSPSLSAAIVVAVVAGAPLAAGQRYSGLDHTRNLVATLCAYAGANGSGVDGDRSVLDRLRGDGPLLEDPQGLYFAPDVRALAAMAKLATEESERAPKGFGSNSVCGSAENAATAFSWLWLVAAAPAASFLAASFGGRRRARFIAGVAQPLLGTSIDLVLHGSFLVEAALVPLIWAGARNLRRRATLRARDAIAIAIGFALLTVHGDLFMDLVAGVLVVAEAVAAVLSRPKRSRTTALASAAFAGLLLSCIQLAPSIGLGGTVQRAHGVESTTVWPLEMPEALGVLLPVRAYERVDVGATLTTAWLRDTDARVEWNSTPFLGALALAALLASIFARRTRPLAIAALVATLFALGAQTPIFPIATRLVPPLALFRYPAKYFELTSLCAAIALAILVEAAPRSALVRRRLRTALAIVAGLVVVALVVLVVSRDSIDAAAAHVATHAPFAGMPSLWSMLVTAAIQSTSFAVAGILLASRSRLSKLLPIAALAEIVLAGFAAMPTSTPILSGPTQAPRPLQSLPANSMVCIGREILARHIDATAPDGSRVDLQLLGDTIADVIDNKPNIGACGGPSFPDDYMPSSEHTVVQLSRYELNEQLGLLGAAIALGCTHLATRTTFVDAEHDAAHFGLVPVALPRESSAGAPNVYAISDALPEVAIARNAHVVADEPALFAKITQANGAADILAIVDDPASALAHGEPGSHDVAVPDGSGVTRVDATFTSARDGNIALGGTGGAVVVMRRQWWPGWTALQNGVELPVVRVGGRELAVVVDDVTRGNVELHYRVRGLAAGLALFAIGAALLAATAAIIRRRARRS
jgi:hypothetical protein